SDRPESTATISYEKLTRWRDRASKSAGSVSAPLRVGRTIDTSGAVIRSLRLEWAARALRRTPRPIRLRRQQSISPAGGGGQTRPADPGGRSDRAAPSRARSQTARRRGIHSQRDG